LFGVAISTYITHSYIRARIQNQFGIDDALQLFAVICLCGTTGMAFSTLQGRYDSMQVILHADMDPSSKYMNKAPSRVNMTVAQATLWWLVIFAVKLAYLFFFRRLIIRLRNLEIWWWCVVVFTIAAGLASLALSWLNCASFTPEEIKCK
jgi:magnesium-transporting ATPase (P-type)